MASYMTFSILLWQFILLFAGPCFQIVTLAAGASGSWTLLKPSIGISAMHMQLLINDRVVIFDRTDFGQSNISLPAGKCPPTWKDCSAHSVEYDVMNNTVRPLMVLSDVWCSSGALMPNGSLTQTGGFNEGDHVVRVFNPCSTCDWQEIPNALAQRRWYATNHLLPDGRQFILGGRGQFNYEFYPKTTSSPTTAVNFPFLSQTNDPGIENNLYPFVFLNVDGNLFIFANNRAVLFNYTQNLVVKTYPQIPGGDPRSYPSSGSAVLLPLKLNIIGAATEAEVLVCGGAPIGSYNSALKGTFVGALNTCGRIKITDPSPQWVMETMPLARVMGDMVQLPNGNILVINGAAAGTAGWELGRSPVFSPLIYRPNNLIGSRFEVQNPSTIPRMYHSTAILLRDGRVLVGGSNPHDPYSFYGALFPTDLSLEAFSPAYLDPQFATLRPQIISPIPYYQIRYGEILNVQFTVSGKVTSNLVTVTMVAPPFNTHSFSMNQRLLVLGGGNVRSKGNSIYELTVPAPRYARLAPSGYYLLFVVHQEIPSVGIWVQIN